jgi:hypothetical protein
MIKAEIVGHSLSPQGDELISVLATFPRIILAEVNTHRMLSKNTSSSRAIPFNKMLEAIQTNPFIPIAWQREHSGMQGTEYWEGEQEILDIRESWLLSRDYAIIQAKDLTSNKVTKQICNRLLEPFMWTTMLITGSREGWDNFFNLRCPNYEYNGLNFKSQNDCYKHFSEHYPKDAEYLSRFSDLDWLKLNKGQAEIHMMALAESIWDATNESTPKQLEPGDWHIPFVDKMTEPFFKTNTDENGTVSWIPLPGVDTGAKEWLENQKVKVSVAMAARTSYTVVGENNLTPKVGDKVIITDDINCLNSSMERYKGKVATITKFEYPDDEDLVRLDIDGGSWVWDFGKKNDQIKLIKKEVNYENLVALHDRLLTQDPPHSSPMEHCARAMSDNEHKSTYRQIDIETNINHIIKTHGWCYNLKGFINYRYFIDNGLVI